MAGIVEEGHFIPIAYGFLPEQLHGVGHVLPRAIVQAIYVESQLLQFGAYSVRVVDGVSQLRVVLIVGIAYDQGYSLFSEILLVFSYQTLPNFPVAARHLVETKHIVLERAGAFGVHGIARDVERLLRGLVLCPKEMVASRPADVVRIVEYRTLPTPSVADFDGVAAHFQYLIIGGSGIKQQQEHPNQKCGFSFHCCLLC